MAKLQFRYGIHVFLLTVFLMVACHSNPKSVGDNSDQKQTLVAESTELPQSIWRVFQASNGDYWFGSNGQGVYQYRHDTLRRYTIQEGLTANQIRGIQEDSNGVLYVETPSGVSKFDGSSFHPLPINPSKDNQWSLSTDDLWFNCNGNAEEVYRYDGKSLIQLSLPRQSLKDSLGLDIDSMWFSPYSVFGIDRDSKSNVWFGTGQAGAFRYDGSSFIWVGDRELCGLPDGRVPGVRKMIEDNHGHMYLSYFKTKYAISEGQYQELDVVASNKEDMESSSYFFNSGLMDSRGNMWMTAYHQKVWKYDGEKLTSIPIFGNPTELLIVSIYEDRNNQLWLGTDNDGVYQYNGEGFGRVEFGSQP